MTDKPNLPDLKGLPKGPWTHLRLRHDVWQIETDDCDGTLIAKAYSEEVARAIASIPDMLVEIERLRPQ